MIRTVPAALALISAMVRLYRPRAELLNDTWKFPEAQPVM
jgi:hypothetical protein